MTGFTAAEQYLARLARKSFLSIWSYPNLFRDEFDSKSGSSEGKEVCDLVIVFGNHILLFSDKDCKFKATNDIRVGWRRWYKKAIESSAKQLFGAERWIKKFPERIFLDPDCKKTFPLEIPKLEDMRFHRIAVVHSISKECRTYFGGGSGSLIFNNSIVGEDHVSEVCRPFEVGVVNPKLGYVHVLDDTTLEILMNSLDTISDFIAYLEKKEQLVKRVKIVAPGEEELLANYLSKLNNLGEHDFDFGGEFDLIALDESHWESYKKNPQAIAKKGADEISYIWDDLIEEFSKHVIDDTQHFTTHPGIAGSEPGLRIMARTTRFERRSLGKSLIEFLQKNSGCQRCSRYIFSPTKKDTVYLFLMLQYPPEKPYEEYRIVRRNMLELYLLGLKIRHPELMDIVGIAIDSDLGRGGSEDLMYLDAREWDESEEEEIKQDLKRTGILQSDPSKNIFYIRDREYPDVNESKPVKGREANKPCRCGSGRKFKKCCGKSIAS